jgi:hypothetical protein
MPETKGLSLKHSSLRYPLIDGYIHNWLIAGPSVTPAESQSGPATNGTLFHLNGGIQNGGIQKDSAEFLRDSATELIPLANYLVNL